MKWVSTLRTSLTMIKTIIEFTLIVKNEINKMSLDQVIDAFQLNIKNKIEWEWKS
jgi:hypothetical protein